jgi:hypothetical protein
VFVTCCVAVRNLRLLAAFEARQGEDARRLAAGLPPKSRRRPVPTKEEPLTARGARICHGVRRDQQN